MTLKSNAAAIAAQEAARRAAEAQRKAAAAAREQAANAKAKAQVTAKSQGAAKAQVATAKAKLAEQAGRKPTASAVRQAFGKNEFSTGLARALKDRLAVPTAPGTSLRTEVLGDGQRNCLEQAVRLAKPGDQIVLLTDQKDAVGHAVVERPDGTVVDPNRPKLPYPSLDAYLSTHPHYSDPAKVSDRNAEQLLKTPPGLARDVLINRLGLTGVAARVVADPGYITAQYQQQAQEAATRARTTFDQTLATGGTQLEAAQAALNVLEASASSKNDPEYRRYVADAAASLAGDLGHAVGTAAQGASSDAFSQTLARLSAFADASSPAFAQAAGAALAAALPDRRGVAPQRYQTGDALHALESYLASEAGQGRSALAASLGAELGRLGKTKALEGVRPAVITALDDVQGAYDTAQQQYVEAESRLGVELQRFGPAMTDAQKQAYVEAFWAQPANATIKSALADAESSLATTFQATAPALEALAQAGDTDAAEKLLKGAQQLASSQSHAEVAIDFVDRLGRPEHKALFDALNHDGTLEDTIANEVLAPALTNAQAAALAGGGVNLDGLVDKLKAIKDHGSNFNKLRTEIGVATEQYATVQRLLAEGKSGTEIRDALRLDDLTRDWDSKSKFGKALAVFGVVGAMGAAINADGNLDRLQASLETVRGGLELTSGVLSSLGRAGKLASGAAAATFLAKLVPGVGLVADGIQLAKDIQALRDGGNVGDWVSTFGTVVNLAGDIAGFIPVAGQVVDGVLTAVGTVIQGLGGLISSVINGNEEAQQNKEEIDARLQAAGVDAHTREVLLTERSIDPTSIAALGLEGSTYLAALEATAPMASDDAYAISASQRAWHVAAAYGLSGEQALHFVQDFTERFNNPQGFQTLQLLEPQINRFTFAAATLAREGRSSAEIRRELSAEFSELNAQLERFGGDLFGQYLSGGANPVPGFYLPQFLDLPN